jgi:hypothetical protein
MWKTQLQTQPQGLFMTPLGPFIVYVIQPLCSTTKFAYTLEHNVQQNLDTSIEPKQSNETFFFHTTISTKHHFFNISQTQSLRT